MKTKELRYIHGCLSTLVERVEEEEISSIKMDRYEEAPLDNHMDFQSLKKDELESVQALVHDITDEIENEADKEAPSQRSM